MKKFLLILVSFVALLHQGMLAESPADLFDWYYGPFPGVKMGANNTMPSFGTINGYPHAGVTVEIPGIADEYPVDRINENGVIETRDMYLLDLSSKKVRIQGPQGSSSAIDVEKFIYANYPTTEWPEPFADGRQKCSSIRFGLLSYEVSKAPGIYTVTFPAGALYINGELTEEFTVTFNVQDNTVYNPYYFTFDVSPITNYPLEELIYPQISIPNRDTDNTKDLYLTKGVSPTVEVTLTCKETGEERKCPFMNVGGSVGRLTWEADLGEVITTPGTYILNIPQGKIQLQDLSTGQYVTNYPLQYTFIVEGEPEPPTPTINYYEGAPSTLPAAGNVTALQTFEINQPNGYAVTLPSKVVPFTLTLPDGTTKNVTPREGWIGHTIYIDLDAPLTKAGEYTLSIPESGLVYYKANSDGDIADENSPLYTRAQTVKYNVTWGQEADLKYTTSPADNSVIFDALENVFITFDEEITPTYGLLATLKWPDGTTVHYPLDEGGEEDPTASPYQYKVTYSEANKRFMVALHYPQTKGVYELTIPAGIAKTADGKINKSFTVTIDWTEREVVDIDIQSDPKNGAYVTTLPQEVFLTLPSEISKTVLGDGGITTVLFFTPSSDSAQNRYIKEAGTKYYIDLRTSYEYSEETGGLYTVQIPEGTFICTMSDGKQVYNAAKTLSWRLVGAGIFEVSVNEDRVTVYDVNGTLLMRDVEKEQLNSLKGIYIVNGIKTVLR